MTTLYLLRHAESIFDPAIPESDWILSENGEAAAHRWVPRLKTLGVTRIYSSPFLRCQNTVAPFAAASGIVVELHPDLRERNLGGFIEDPSDFFATMERLWNDRELRYLSGETGAEVTNRIYETLGELARHHAGETLLVSSHGQALSHFLRCIDPGVDFNFWKEMKNPDLFKVTWDGNNFHHEVMEGKA
ncbi:MAG: histidine phosphatase family protein [Alphaproteobacteria bacterium]|nr:MAG: histidine phosphatase family protein [Alphaproteobacteria bacterium]